MNHHKVKLDSRQEQKVKAISKKDFYEKLIDENTKEPLRYFRKSMKFDPQVGNFVAQ